MFSVCGKSVKAKSYSLATHLFLKRLRLESLGYYLLLKTFACLDSISA